MTKSEFLLVVIAAGATAGVYALGEKIDSLRMINANMLAKLEKIEEILREISGRAWR